MSNQKNYSFRNYFLKSSLYVGFSQIISLLAPMIIIPFLISKITLSNYGLYSIAFSWSLFLSLIVDFGFNITGINAISKNNSIQFQLDKIIHIISAKFFIFLVITSIYLFCIFTIPYFNHEKRLYIYSLFVPLSFVFNTNWIFQGLEKMELYSAVSTIPKIIFLFLVFIFISNPSNYIFILPLFGISTIITSIFSLFFLKNFTPNKNIAISIVKTWAEIKDSFSYFVSNISVFLSMNFYIPILGIFASNEQVAIYSVIEKIYYGIRSMFSVYVGVMLPRLSRLISTQKNNVLNIIKETYIFVIIILITVSIILFFNINILVEFFIKKPNIEMGNMILLSLIGLFILLFNTPIYVILLSLDMKKEIVKIFFIIPITSLIFCYFLAKNYNVKGVVYCIILTEFFYSFSLIYIYFSQKIYKRITPNF